MLLLQTSGAGKYFHGVLVMTALFSRLLLSFLTSQRVADSMVNSTVVALRTQALRACLCTGGGLCAHVEKGERELQL